MKQMFQSAANSVAMPPPATGKDSAGLRLFLKRWAANPLQMGSVVPSSPALCRRVAAQVRRQAGEAVLELGAGTGVISRALIEGGVPPSCLFAMEIVPAMASHLRQLLPGATVLTGDARLLPDLLPAAWHGRIGTVVCGIPLVLLKLAEQRRFIDAIEAVATRPRLPALQLLRHLAAALAQARAGRRARGMDAAEPAARQRLALHAALTGPARAISAWRRAPCCYSAAYRPCAGTMHQELQAC